MGCQARPGKVVVVTGISLASSRVLVTGGAGFVGSHIVRSLLETGAEVAVFDNFSTGSRRNLEPVLGDVELIEGDVLDAAAVARAARGRDVISHQAAQLEITHALADPVDDMRTNIEGTLNVLAAARRAGVGKVMNASSACVYGQARSDLQPETDPTEPNWEYGISKLAAEKYGRLAYEHDGLNVTSLRYAIIYGPREWYGRVLTIFLKRALDGDPLVVFGDGSQVRDFTYVGDLVRVHNRCIEDPAAAGEVFNVSTGLGTSLADLATIVQEATGAEVPVIHEEVAEGAVSEAVPGRLRVPHELQRMVLDNRHARDLLGYAPDTTLAKGLHEQIEWLTGGGLETWDRIRG